MNNMLKSAFRLYTGSILAFLLIGVIVFRNSIDLSTNTKMGLALYVLVGVVIFFVFLRILISRLEFHYDEDITSISYYLRKYGPVEDFDIEKFILNPEMPKKERKALAKIHKEANGIDLESKI